VNKNDLVQKLAERTGLSNIGKFGSAARDAVSEFVSDDVKTTR